MMTYYLNRGYRICGGAQSGVGETSVVRSGFFDRSSRAKKIETYMD